MQPYKITVAITTHSAVCVSRALSFGIYKNSQWDISLCEAEIANAELVLEVCVCVCVWRERKVFHDGLLYSYQDNNLKCHL